MPEHAASSDRTWTRIGRADVASSGLSVSGVDVFILFVDPQVGPDVRRGHAVLTREMGEQHDVVVCARAASVKPKYESAG